MATALLLLSACNGEKIDSDLIDSITGKVSVEKITIDQEDFEMTEGESTVLTATVLPADATDKTVSWHSSKEDVVMISNTGKVMAIAPGKSIITAKAGSKTDFITITVIANAVHVTGISLDKTSIVLKVDDSETLTATVTPPDATNKNVSWTSSDAAVATVENGKVTGVKPGSVTITAKTEDGGKSASCQVEVKQYVTGITLNKTSLILIEGAKEQLTATISPTTASDKSVTWSSDDISVAMVDPDGKISAISKGTATITATANDGSEKSASCEVAVYDVIVNLSANGSANCYIVSSSGAYGFRTTQGNSSTSVGSVSSAVVLWESYGTSTAPSVGSIINNVSYSSNTITFSTPTTLENGNAVIAAKDASGKILWCWHIWVCEGYNPATTAQTYYNNAGVMMDRNLGATSATPGNVGALGLLYQWGRKDPFLGSSSISSGTKAKSTLSTWPSPVSSNSSNGTIAYAVKNPTTFIKYNSSNYDWYYTGSSSTDNTRWQTSKTIYDPCPPGWKVPTGGSSGVWSKAAGSSSSFSYNWDSTHNGMNFSGKFGSASTIWYPAAGCLDFGGGSLSNVGNNGSWWSCTPYDYYAYTLYLFGYGNVYPSGLYYRAYGYSVRCLQE